MSPAAPTAESGASPAVALLRRLRLVPVITLDDAAIATDLAQTLLEAGIPGAEFTLRTAAGMDAVRRAAAVAGFAAGVGTVLDVEAVAASVDAGARFAVAPGLDAATVTRAQELGLDFLPGVATPSEVQQALRLGLDTVKLFPAALLGGPAYVSALAAPFPQLSFLPSGGIGEREAPDYLALSAVPAVSGSWMVPSALIRAGDLEGIHRLARAAVTALSGAGS